MRYTTTNTSTSLTQQLTWTSEPKTVLVIKKPCDHVFDSFLTIISYLIEKYKLTIFIEEKDYNHDYLAQNEQINEFKASLAIQKFLSDNDFNIGLVNNNNNNATNQIDMIICLGGDGTLLHASTLFQVKKFLLKFNFLIFCQFYSLFLAKLSTCSLNSYGKFRFFMSI